MLDPLDRLAQLVRKVSTLLEKKYVRKRVKAYTITAVEPFTLEKLAERLNYSERHLRNILKLKKRFKSEREKVRGEWGKPDSHGKEGVESQGRPKIKSRKLKEEYKKYEPWEKISEDLSEKEREAVSSILAMRGDMTGSLYRLNREVLRFWFKHGSYLSEHIKTATKETENEVSRKASDAFKAIENLEAEKFEAIVRRLRRRFEKRRKDQIRDAAVSESALPPLERDLPEVKKIGRAYLLAIRLYPFVEEIFKKIARPALVLFLKVIIEVSTRVILADYEDLVVEELRSIESEEDNQEKSEK